MRFLIPVQEPSDGFDQMERAFLRQLIITMYRVLPNPEDKFIMIAIHEMGYSQDAVAQMLGKSQVVVSGRLKRIKLFLKNHPLMANMQ